MVAKGRRKLFLSTETVRSLDLEPLGDRDLNGAVGGTGVQTLEGDCWVITIESLCYPCASYTCQ